MSTEPQRTCPSCGNEFSGAMEFCPVCVLRKALAVGVESGGSSASEDPVEPKTPGRWGSLVENTIEGQNLVAEDQLFILMQSGLYLTATRGLGAPEARICYERAETLCHSHDSPVLLYVALMGQWRFSLMNDKLTATMQIAKRVHSMAKEQKSIFLEKRAEGTYAEYRRQKASASAADL